MASGYLFESAISEAVIEVPLSKILLSMISKPDPEESPKYFHYFINLIPEEELLEAMDRTRRETVELIASVPRGMDNFRYAADKWAVKQLIQHIIDTERILAYRALRFSRKDPTPLAAFDENAFAERDNSRGRTLADLSEEFEVVRASSVVLFRSMTDDMLKFRGMSNNMPTTTGSWGWMIAGHNAHHNQVLRKRYL
jgi:hypothetical protein